MLHMFKVRPPIEFLNVGVANPLITQMLLSYNFSMNTNFVDLTELYKLGVHSTFLYVFAIVCIPANIRIAKMAQFLLCLTCDQRVHAFVKRVLPHIRCHACNFFLEILL